MSCKSMLQLRNEGITVGCIVHSDPTNLLDHIRLNLWLLNKTHLFTVFQLDAIQDINKYLGKMLSSIRARNMNKINKIRAKG